MGFDADEIEAFGCRDAFIEMLLVFGFLVGGSMVAEQAIHCHPGTRTLLSPKPFMKFHNCVLDMTIFNSRRIYCCLTMHLDFIDRNEANQQVNNVLVSTLSLSMPLKLRTAHYSIQWSLTVKAMGPDRQALDRNCIKATAPRVNI